MRTSPQKKTSSYRKSRNINSVRRKSGRKKSVGGAICGAGGEEDEWKNFIHDLKETDIDEIVNLLYEQVVHSSSYKAVINLLSEEQKFIIETLELTGDNPTLLNSIGDYYYKQVVETYDTNYFDNISIAMQEDIINKVENRGKHTLMRLIYNYNNTTTPNISYITGPSAISQFHSKKYDKMVYIFYEQHGLQEGCDSYDLSPNMEIQDYLFELFQNTNVFIDFYYEMDLYDDIKTFSKVYDPYKYITYIDKLRGLISRCSIPATRDVPECKLIRAHLSDIRHTTNTHPTIRKFLYHLPQNHKTSRELFDSIINDIETIPGLLDLIRYYASSVHNVVDAYINILEQASSKIEKSYIHSQIKEFIINNIIPEALNVHKASKKIIMMRDSGISGTEYDNAAYNFKGRMIRLDARRMDVYLLSRVFRKFNISNNKANNIDQPLEAHNIIIYAGGAHSNLYAKFLEFLEFDKLYEYLGGYSSKGFSDAIASKQSELEVLNTRCVPMGGVKQPLFRRNPNYSQPVSENINDFYNLKNMGQFYNQYKDDFEEVRTIRPPGNKVIVHTAESSIGYIHGDIFSKDDHTHILYKKNNIDKLATIFYSKIERNKYKLIIPLKISKYIDDPIQFYENIDKSKLQHEFGYVELHPMLHIDTILRNSYRIVIDRQTNKLLFYP